MAYCEADDVREALAPEDQWDSPATAAVLEDDQINDAISEAAAEIDARVSGAPFTDTPRLIFALTRDIAAYLATLTHRKGTQLPVDHPVALRYARAQKLLDKAAAGQVDLSDDTEAAAGSGVAVVNPYEGDLFTFEDLGLGPRPPDAFPPWVR